MPMPDWEISICEGGVRIGGRRKEEGWEKEVGCFFEEKRKDKKNSKKERGEGVGKKGRGREREKVLPFGQLQLEIHLWNGEGERTFEEFLKWWEVLEDSGLRPFWTEVRGFFYVSFHTFPFIHFLHMFSLRTSFLLTYIYIFSRI